MQVKHEAQLIESLPLKPEDFSQVSKWRTALDTYTIEQSPLNGINQVSCCPASNLAAVYLSKSQQIVLIDTKGYLKRDRFPLKACDKKFSRHSFTVRGLDFSPDGMRLAVGQSDCIIYIYKLPSQLFQQADQPGDSLGNSKATISGKFLCAAPVTCLLWAEFGIVFGTQDGRVKLIQLTSARQAADGVSASAGGSQAQNASASSSCASSTALASSSSSRVVNLLNPAKGSSMPISLAARFPVVAVAYADHTIQVVSLNGELPAQTGEAQFESTANGSGGTRRNSAGGSQAVLLSSIQHSCPAYQLSILHNNTLACAGPDGRIALHAPKANKLAWLQNVNLKEDVLSMDYSNVNEMLALVTKGRLLFMRHELELNSWQLQSSFVEVAEAYSLTSVKWLRDGTQLLLGTLSGSLELFECSWNKQATLADQLEICHIAKNRVRITDRARNLLATYKTQADIKRVNLLEKGQGVIIWTSSSLLLAQMSLPNLQSEIGWSARDKSAKFSFRNLGFVLILNAASKELSVVKLGSDSLLYKVHLQAGEASLVRRSTICVRQYPSMELKQQVSASDSSPTSLRAQAERRLSEFNGDLEQLPESLVEGLVRKEARDGRQRLAYASEMNTLLKVVDLRRKSEELSLRLSSPVERLDFSRTTNKLLLLDAARELSLISLNGGEPKKLLLNECEFASWLPNSDILVCQRREQVSIWYNIEDLDDVWRVDSRSRNVINMAPIFDLSLISAQNSLNRKAYPTITSLAGESILLSNGQSIPLDRTKVKFYREIVERRLESALAIVTPSAGGKQACPERLRRKLLNKLGWLAVEAGDCKVAMEAFRALGYTSMVNCLRRCEESGAPEEREWRLAMLRGDWETFEEIASAEHIILTYKRLNKWQRLILYLNRTQQFRQRDLAEEEYRKWLMDKGRFVEAAQIWVRAGDLLGALELLIANSKHDEALELALREQKAPLQGSRPEAGGKPRSAAEERLVELFRRLKAEFEEAGAFEKAAKISERLLDEPEEAFKLYLRGESFERALELARSQPSLFDAERLAGTEEAYAKHLVEAYRARSISRKKALPAIRHLLDAKLYFESLSLAVELGDFERAYKIVETQEAELKQELNSDEEKLAKLREFCNSIGDIMLKKGSPEEAIKVYLAGENFKLAIKLAIEQADYERAFEFAAKHLDGDNHEKTRDRFGQLAKWLAEEEKAYEKAEKIYLLIERPEMAIEMHKAAKNYDRMLELIGEFQADFLESNLLILARQMEADGRLEEAERYLLRASEEEWTSAVRMYRLANRWEEAFRVAREHCSSARDPLLVQLAFWWSKSLASSSDVGKARELLLELKLFNLVIEFCCENKNYQFAIDLCTPPERGDSSLESKRKEVIRRFAVSLEEAQKFKEAEELLLRYGHFEEAVEMYVDNDLYPEALRIIEEQIGRRREKEELAGSPESSRMADLLNSTLIKCADRLVEQVRPAPSRQQPQFQSRNGLSMPAASQEKLQRAQQLYLRAQRPEMAVEMYKERGMWQDAIQVAQRFAPQLLESVESALDAQIMTDVAPILAEVSAGRKSASHSGSSSSTGRVSLASGSGSGAEQRATAGEPNGRKSFKQMASSVLQSRAEESIRSGDLRNAKLALSKFMDTLVDGQGHLLEVRLVRLNLWLAELAKSEQAGRLAEHARVLQLADLVIGHAGWGLKELRREPEAAVWFRLRDCLASFRRERASPELEGGPAAEGARPAIGLPGGELERRLLISHYVSLHACLVEHLYRLLNLDSKSTTSDIPPPPMAQQTKHASSRPAGRFRGPGGHSGASARNGGDGGAPKVAITTGGSAPASWPASLSPSQAERLKSQLAACASSSPARRRELADVLGLISKLSLSLLRYSDLLEARAAFQVAGFWLLVGDRLQLARFVWTRFMELLELTSGEPASSRVQFELERAGVPASPMLSDSPETQPNQLTQSLANEIRQWLLESLIESSQAAGRRVSLDNRGQLECSLFWRSQPPLEPCLVSGYPVFPGADQVILCPQEGRTLNQVRLSDWKALTGLASGGAELEGRTRPADWRRNQQSLNHIIDFILRLSGAEAKWKPPKESPRVLDSSSRK